MQETKKKRPFAVDKEKRKARRLALRRVERTSVRVDEETGDEARLTKTVEQCPERAESLGIVQEMTRAYIASIDYYKSDYGGSSPHDEAVKKHLSMNEWRRDYVKDLQPEKVEWSHLAAIAEADVTDSIKLWERLRDAADNDLESGKRASEIVGSRVEPYALAQFFAIRNSFADQWQPNGGIESAMLDMMTIAFSLQMYWSQVAHRRSVEVHNSQERELGRIGTKGWKSPYQHEAGAIDQAYKLADGYNRQFLRVLRQLRDLRRYAPVIIQNNGGQVNIGEQQVNLKQ